MPRLDPGGEVENHARFHFECVHFERENGHEPLKVCIYNIASSEDKYVGKSQFLLCSDPIVQRVIC